MSEDTRKLVVNIVLDTAPELDVSESDTSKHLREELGLDSMDFLDIVTRIYEETGVEIPESDYEQLESIDDLVSYVEEH